jgi:hypothetical protein
VSQTSDPFPCEAAVTGIALDGTEPAAQVLRYRSHLSFSGAADLRHLQDRVGAAPLVPKSLLPPVDEGMSARR